MITNHHVGWGKATQVFNNLGIANNAAPTDERKTPKESATVRNPTSKAARRIRPRTTSRSYSSNGQALSSAERQQIDGELEPIDGVKDVLESPTDGPGWNSEEDDTGSTVQDLSKSAIIIRELELSIKNLKAVQIEEELRHEEQLSPTKDLEAQVQRLQEELKRERESRQVSVHQMQLVLDSKELCVGMQQSDSVVLGSFRMLFGQVKNWVSNLSEITRPMPAGPSAELFEPLLLAAPGPSYDAIPQSLSASVKTRRWVLRAGLSSILCANIFRCSDWSVPSAAMDIWLDQEMSGCFSALENRLSAAGPLKIPVRSLNDWRALTAELLSATDQDATDRHHKVEYLHLILKPILKLAAFWASDQDRKHMGQQLLTIFERAVDFSQMLRRQRASWSIRYPVDAASSARSPTHRQALPFDRDTMEDIDDDDEEEEEGPESKGSARPKLVDYFIEPALLKRGNMEGGNFDMETCACRAVVVCRGRMTKPGCLKRS